MRHFVPLVSLLSALCVTAQSADEIAKAPEEIVKDGISELRIGMASEEEATRQAAFDKFMPTEAHVTLLFGEDHAKSLWEKMGPGLKRMRENTGEYLKSPTAKKEIVGIEVIDVRTEPSSGPSYGRVLKMIPETIPVYRAVIRYETSTSGSSAYLVIDGNMVFFRGLSSIPEFIDSLKK